MHSIFASLLPLSSSDFARVCGCVTEQSPTEPKLDFSPQCNQHFHCNLNPRIQFKMQSNPHTCMPSHIDASPILFNILFETAAENFPTSCQLKNQQLKQSQTEKMHNFIQAMSAKFAKNCTKISFRHFFSSEILHFSARILPILEFYFRNWICLSFPSLFCRNGKGWRFEA